MNCDEILAKVQREVRDRLAGQGAGHGFDHVARVVANSKLLQSETGGDSFIVELAALLHDVGDAKFHQGVERSGEISRQVLGALQLNLAIVDHVVQIVENISFRKRATAATLSLEGQIVQDGDRLDALGAIGIVRTIEYGASVGQPFHVLGQREVQTGIGHFHEKLFKLSGLMNTDAGKRIALEREKFMRGFIRQFEAEVDAAAC